jgi:hypothetical protein
LQCRFGTQMFQIWARPQVRVLIAEGLLERCAIWSRISGSRLLVSPR